MRYYRFLILIGWLWLFSLQAEPLNVLVGDVTFTRPASWQMAPPAGRSPATVRFLAEEPGKAPVDIRFYAPGKTVSEARAQWEKFVAPADAGSIRQQEKKIGKRTITYISFEGKLKVPGEPAIANGGFLGAVIPYEDKSMHIRMFGPKAGVLATTTAFKKMLEEGVREREAEIDAKGN